MMACTTMPNENTPDDASAPEEERRAPATFDLPEEFLNDETALLVQSAQTGDANALNELFTRYHQIMIDVARRQLGPKLRLKEDPDDLAQTTFREATRDFSRYRYRGESSLLGWLIQILKNKIRDKAEFYSAGKRDQGRERPMEVSDAAGTSSTLDFPSEDLSVTQMVSRDENVGILREALTDLSEEHRKAITLVFFEGLSLREAGKRLDGRSEDAVRMMLRRAEAKLGDRLRGTLGRDLS
ncbi:MAG: RNA polymerase sigma-70 factor (ECF subfamily) [Planctomycetota bacterium]|jgi:RNA polymerase sigma-70 factor (ECF subfamily)